MSFKQSFGAAKAEEPFDHKFYSPHTKLRSWGICLDVKTVPYEQTIPLCADGEPGLLGTVVAVDSGRRLLVLRSDDGAVTIRNAKMEYLDDKRIRIEFDPAEQD